MRYRIRKCPCGYWVILQQTKRRRVVAERATFALAWEYLEYYLDYEATQ